MSSRRIDPRIEAFAKKMATIDEAVHKAAGEISSKTNKALMNELLASHRHDAATRLIASGACKNTSIDVVIQALDVIEQQRRVTWT